MLLSFMMQHHMTAYMNKLHFKSTTLLMLLKLLVFFNFLSIGVLLCILYKVHSNSKHCLRLYMVSCPLLVKDFLVLVQLLQLIHEFEIPSCITSQFARYFLPAQSCMWNNFPSSMLKGFKQPRVGCFPELIFSY